MKRNLPQSVCVRRPLRVFDRISLETPDPHCSCFITAQLNVIHPDGNAVLFAVGLELARPSVRTLEGAGNRQLVVPRHRYLICPGFRLIYIFDNRRFLGPFFRLRNFLFTELHRIIYQQSVFLLSEKSSSSAPEILRPCGSHHDLVYSLLPDVYRDDRSPAGD